MGKKISLDKIMFVNVITGSKDESICDIAKKMKKHKVGVIIITNKKGSIEGIVSSRDILNKVVCKGLDSRKVNVKEIMTKKVVTGNPKMTDAEAASIFSKHGIKKLPVVKNKKLVGIITQTDMLKLSSIKWAL